MPALSPGQVAYWQRRLAATATNAARAAVLWDLARTLSAGDEEKQADLVRMLSAWTQQHAAS
ncbi:hypothetical protein PUR71_33215 [Streptomyces sp. SP17BM10]|uniref:hypothetical protein n=1 Tax=Streptomyces sp. SP17BM10 TaxID=3002530 RepID=UPI002E796CB1|nr:hypothetical protein [Streptomyces sp. SP17BM10]MEE1787732.1 hypothetical protein [Streptomyces sp. SP17BM10]